MTELKTFSLQEKLPRLPIPPLKDTIERYLETTQPLFTDKAEYEAYRAVATEFVNSLGPKLQERLIAYDKTQPKSWLERWWLSLAYLGWRESLLVNSNWYYLTTPHPQAPTGLLADGHSLRPKNGTWSWFQLDRAAGFLSGMLDYKDSLESGSFKPETTRSGPLCMNQYRNIFGISRVAQEPQDVLVGGFPCVSSHVIVVARDQLFVMHVYDPVTHQRLRISDIRRQLDQVVAQVEQLTVSKQLQPHIGLLTGEHRDTWSRLYNKLQHLGNEATFKWIQTAILAVCLDDRYVPNSLDDLARTVFHNNDGRNRWFDACLNVVVTNDARIGVNGEHSPCDALVPALAADYAAHREPATDPPGAVSSDLKVVHLKWTVDADILQGLKDAQTYITKTIRDSDLHVVHFTQYGADFIKKVAKVSPDAYIQMCLQLVFYRLHGTHTAVYETISTRKFLHGRTETCRSLSNESKAFVVAFDDHRQTPVQKHDALIRAAKRHGEYLDMGGNGLGVDRHLLGLRLCLEKGESSELFTHPMFSKSSKWRLSTSALFASDMGVGTGFGAVYPDGYGMNYSIGDRVIKMGVESKISCRETSTAKFTRMFEQTMVDIAKVCKAASKPTL